MHIHCGAYQRFRMSFAFIIGHLNEMKLAPRARKSVILVRGSIDWISSSPIMTLVCGVASTGSVLSAIDISLLKWTACCLCFDTAPRRFLLKLCIPASYSVETRDLEAKVPPSRLIGILISPESQIKLAHTWALVEESAAADCLQAFSIFFILY